MVNDCIDIMSTDIVPVSLAKFKLLSKVYAENDLHIIRLVTNKNYGFLAIKVADGITYYVRAKMKTLEKYLRKLGSNMDFEKVEHRLVKVTFGD